MKFFAQVVSGILILIPFLIGVVVPISATPPAIIQANSDSRANNFEFELVSLQVLLDYQPARTDLWERMGRLQLNTGNYVKAIRSFTESQSHGGLSVDGHLWLADALISNNEVSKAKDLLRTVTQNMDDTFSLLQAASMQRRIGDVFGAEATLIKAYGIDPLNSEVNFMLGVLLSATQPDSAMKFLTFKTSNNTDKAMLSAALMEIITQNETATSDSVRFRSIGQVLSNFGYWDIAMRAFQSSVDLDPKSGVNWALLAEATQQNGLDGSPYISTALDLDPGNEIVNGLAALTYRRQKKSELALLYLEKASTLNPNTNVWEIEIGNTYAEMGNLDEAFLHYTKAINKTPTDWIGWKSLAVFCITHNYEVQSTGLPAARRALSLKPDSPPLLDLVGAGLMVVKDFDSAERFFLRAEQLDPNQSAVLIHLGQLKISQKDFPNARIYLQHAAEYARDNRIRELANRLMLEIEGK
jgi:tetratricopeptide (TPR) repeat protein